MIFLKQINTAFEKENEMSLSYLIGVKIDKLENLEESKYCGVFLQTLFYFYTLIKALSFKKRKFNKNAEVLIFAGTRNQYNSLFSTMKSLDGLGVEYNLIVLKETGIKNGAYKVSFIDFLRSALVFFCRAPKLYFSLKRSGKKREINYFFARLCESYIYYPYFFSMLKKMSSEKEVKLVVMSNDHNVSNRCLRLACEILNIKTMYMQHASVSEHFPPLQYDYALLDGYCAYQTYERCSVNLPELSIYKSNVFLSGQKKIINNDERSDRLFNIGIALNTLDDFSKLEELVKKLRENKFTLLIRTHPSQSREFIKKLLLMTDKENVVWSNPIENSLSCFFNSISSLIAANSSIHLEAALAGKVTYYYEFSCHVKYPDYYGYVKCGLSYKLDDSNLVASLDKGVTKSLNEERFLAIKRYSETYMTKWSFKEGELVANLIVRIISNKSFEEFFNISDMSGIYTLFEIKE